MKRAILFVLLGAGLGGGAVWLWQREDSHSETAHAPEAREPAGESAVKTSVTRDAAGHTVVTVSPETQDKMGLRVARPEARRLPPETKAYGRVLDPAPLAALWAELTSAHAAAAVSSNELARLKTLEAQGNASARAVQAAEAAWVRDQLAVSSARDRLALGWGDALAQRADLPAVVRALVSLGSALVRLELPAGATLAALPVSARLLTLAGESAQAEPLGPAPARDPQTQARSFLFLVRTNAPNLRPGESVTGFIQLAGAPRAGVVIPREAIVRTEGRSWVYLRHDGGDTFTRTEIALERPLEAGWFVSQGVTPASELVTAGAQQLLSEELKGQGGEEE